jgi:dienelactone hydrolase
VRRVLLACAALLVGAAPAAAFDAQREAANFRHIDQRRSVEQSDPGWYQAILTNGATDTADILQRDAASGGDRFSGSLCGEGMLTCAGDPRTRDWSGGVSTPVLYKNRNGAHIEGHVWVGSAFKQAGAGALPGVVIETGSVQAPERWYYWAAQVLATHGYEVMTFDVQGQGRSDMFGSHDQAHFAKGFPAQDTTHFVEDLEDAIDFFNSNANPHRALLDTDRLGIVGHSLGANSVSIVQAQDKRVDAAVAWDNVDTGVTPRVPMLGMSADYQLDPTPFTSDPDPASKSAGFAKWKAAGVDAMQVVLRGATHYEWSYAPMMLPASLRGIDTAAWYTTAWLDKYVKGDASADARLLTDRWRADPVDKGLDGAEAGNLYSFYFRSPLAFTLDDGTKVACDDARSGCAALRADDGVTRDHAYSYMTDRGAAG